MKKLIVLLALLTAAPANAQYGGGWGIYGPYGRPPRGAYGPPPPPRRYGPQMEPCIYRGECGPPRYDDGGPPPMPPFRLPPRW